MFDLYINPATGDLDYQNGSLSLVRDTNKRVRQELEVTLRAFKGEWFNNTQFGGINRDYIGRVGITKQEVDAWYRRIILSNPEVLELVNFQSSFNRFSRQYDLEFVVRTKKGEENVRVALRPDQEVSYTLPPQEEYLPPTTPAIKTMSAFITGTSDIVSIFSKNAISFVAAPIAGTASVTATATRTFQSVTITGTGSISAGAGTKAISATITGSGDITAYISTVMAAALTPSVDTVSATVAKVLSSTMTTSTGFSASMSKQLSATISASGDITAGVAFGGMALLAGTSAVTASVAKSMVASISGSDSIVANVARALSATISGSDSVSAAIAKPSSATITGTGAITASAVKPMSVVMNDAGWIAWPLVLNKVLSSTINNTHNITAAINKSSSANLSGSNTVSANITKVKYASANIAGGNDTVVANMTKIKEMSANISGNSTVTSASAIVYLTEYDKLLLQNTGSLNTNRYYRLGEVTSGTSFPDSKYGASTTTNVIPSYSTTSLLGNANTAITLPASGTQANYLGINSSDYPSSLSSWSLVFWVEFLSSPAGFTVANFANIGPIIGVENVGGTLYWTFTLRSAGGMSTKFRGPLYYLSLSKRMVAMTVQRDNAANTLAVKLTVKSWSSGGVVVTHSADVLLYMDGISVGVVHNGTAIIGTGSFGPLDYEQRPTKLGCFTTSTSSAVSLSNISVHNVALDDTNIQSIFNASHL